MTSKIDRDRRVALQAAAAGAAMLACPAWAGGQAGKSPSAPATSRTAWKIGYFGDSVARGACNLRPAPGNTQTADFFPTAQTLQTLVSTAFPATVTQEGVDALAGSFLLSGGAYERGKTVAPLADRLRAGGYGLIVVTVGISDARLGQSVAQFEKTLLGIVQAARAQGVVPVFETPNRIATPYAARMESYRPSFGRCEFVADQAWSAPMGGSDPYHPKVEDYPRKLQRLAEVVIAAARPPAARR